jgi:mRNA interferase RelE/StbE
LSYHVDLKKSAAKQLENLPAFDREKILQALIELKTTPRPPGCKKLSGGDGWRIRSQNYRVIYDIDDAGWRILIQVIGHRREVYRR